MKRKTIQELCDERYEDADLIAAIIADAERLETTERIESGELTLPHPTDAQIWHERNQAADKAEEARHAKAKPKGSK
jgi:hypothetical protein